MTQERWCLTGGGPDSYERYQVPSVFGPLARTFLQCVALRPGQHVLDVACGTGIVARHAWAILGPEGRVVGVDLNAGMLAVARQHAPRNGVPVEWRLGDAAALPCSDGEFDVVLCQQGLQFFPDKARAVREMHRVLKPGGLVGLCVWRAIEHSPCHAAIADALGRHVGARVARTFQAPFGFADPAAIESVLIEAGFSEVAVRVEVVTRRLLPAEESIPGLLASTPVGPEIAGLDAATRDAIVRDVAAALAGYVDGDGLTVPQPTYVATGRKRSTAPGRRATGGASRARIGGAADGRREGNAGSAMTGRG